MMKKIKTLVAVFAVLAAAGSVLSAQPVGSKEFTYDEKTNKEIARKLKIPVYFAVPASARAEVPEDIGAVGRLIDFKHPDAKDAKGDVGLRVVVTRRSGLARRLGKSGLVQTGDLLLTFRPEWGGAGAYPSVQLGISHTGLAYVKDGVLHNLDNPLNEEYHGAGMRGELTGAHYGTLKLLHIVRPRGLTDAQRANLLEWSTRLNRNAKRIYPGQIKFNQDYNAPKYKRDRPVDFVKHLGQAALGQSPAGSVSMFCSEFAWSLLALRNCDPRRDGEAFKRSGIPSCIKPAMKPMRATGNYIARRGRHSYTGLAEGPLMVVDAMKLPAAERDKVLHTVFVADSRGMSKMSVGHRTLAQSMQPKFAPLEEYYTGANSRFIAGWKARMIGNAFNKNIPENYSPTSFLINTFLPSNNVNRTMDYVATIMIE